MGGAKLSGAKLSWCQIVLVPNCPGAKLSTFIILVPNCPLLLSWCQIVRCQIVNISGKIWYLILAEIAKKKGIFFTFFVLVPNCPVPNCPGAKLSWCQIVLVPNCPLLLSWCQIVRFYYLGAKLSSLLSWCQIVLFIILVPNCLVPNCLVPNCPVPNCPTIKIRYHIFHFKHIHPKMKNKKKRSFILMRTQIGFN